jgi:hypothetical protein
MGDGLYSADAHFQYDGRHHNGTFDRYNFCRYHRRRARDRLTIIYMGVKGGGLLKRESQSETGAR